MKVLLITSTFPRFEGDGFAKWLGELTTRLKSKGVDVKVLAPSHKGSASHKYRGISIKRFRYAPSFLEVLTHEEGAVFKLRKNPFLIFLVFTYLFFGSIATIKEVIENDYDVVHVQWPFPNGVFGLIAKFFKKLKLVLTFHGAEFTLLKKTPLGGAILSFIIRNSEGVTANSRDTKRKIRSIKRVPVEIIPFTSVFDSQNTKASKKDNKVKRILFVGRLIERKGLSYLIDAIPKVLDNAKTKLYIVGGGPLLGDLKKQISSLSLEKNIFLLGKVSEKKLKKMYESCDVFVLPSIIDKWGDTEGLGVVLLEAMSFKKPVVASRVGGVTDIVKNETTGLTVPQKNSTKLAFAITRIFKNKRLRNKLGKNGYNFVKENFNWNLIIRKTIRVYTK